MKGKLVSIGNRIKGRYGLYYLQCTVSFGKVRQGVLLILESRSGLPKLGTEVIVHYESLPEGSKLCINQ